MNSRKYLLGVNHAEGEEELALEILRQNSCPNDLVAIELEPMTMGVFRNTINQTIQDPERLKEILKKCKVPFSYYWTNLMRLTFLENLRLRFIPIDNRELINKGINARSRDEYFSNYIIGRERYFETMIKTYNPHGIIVGSEHVDFLSEKFPEYSIPYKTSDNDPSLSDQDRIRIKELRETH
ncbi:hypothetical protein J4466_01455 [Candidatus Pacearchaeota archaeon]|nr:hypothetical protein [Candidatus Pacearchaeota archaeon]